VTNLLSLGLDERAWYFVTKDDALNVELNARALVVRENIDGDELFPIPQHLTKLYDWPLLIHVCSS
jgi:hypothetical protein